MASSEIPSIISQSEQPFEEEKSSTQKVPTSKPICKCDSRAKDEEEKLKIQQQIAMVYEDIIQLEQALIELDEQNTLNALEIKKREAKVFLLEKQIEDMEENRPGSKENVQNMQNLESDVPNEVAFIKKHIE